LTDFVPVAGYAVYGLRNRYRQPGIGVPVAAQTMPMGAGAPGDWLIEDKVRVPGTLVLRLDHPRKQIVETTLLGRLNLYAATDRDTVEINGHQVPLEVDRSATVAITLAESQFWNQEIAHFLGDVTGVRRRTRLVAAEPYRPGRIPVVFVHGT